MTDAVQRFVEGLTRGRTDPIIDCFAPGAVVWHNFDEVELDKATFRQSLDQLFELMPQRAFTITGRYGSGDGIVWQYLFEGRNSAGAAVRISGCWVFKLKDGLIRRLDEYVDSAQIARIAG